MERIDGFDWDDGNRQKSQKHGVSIAEIESVFAAPIIIIPDPVHSAHETRMRAIGRAANGRHVFVAFTVRYRQSRTLIRPVSARYIHRKEVTRYEADNPQIEKDSSVQDR